MNWKPSHLTRVQMNERRQLGGHLLRKGQLAQSAIAQQLGVSRQAVSQWQAILTDTGPQGLSGTLATGRPSRLTSAQKTEVVTLLTPGAQAAGFATEQWTLARVQRLIHRQFRVTYHPNYVGRLLQTLGWSVQKPTARARERDEDQIQTWLDHDWARIKKKPAANRRILCWWTNMAFRS